MTDKFEFDPEVYQQRFLDHWFLFDKFIDDFTTRFPGQFDLNARRFYLVIVSAYKDIERYKNFHLEAPSRAYSDEIKRSAYLVKWICKIKPILPVIPEEADRYDHTNGDPAVVEYYGNDEFDQSELVNEFFAVFIAFVHLSEKIGRDFLPDEDKEYDIVYDLVYRRIDEDGLMILFQQYCESGLGLCKFIFL